MVRNISNTVHDSVEMAVFCCFWRDPHNVPMREIVFSTVVLQAFLERFSPKDGMDHFWSVNPVCLRWHRSRGTLWCRNDISKMGIGSPYVNMLKISEISHAKFSCRGLFLIQLPAINVLHQKCFRKTFALNMTLFVKII